MELNKNSVINFFVGDDANARSAVEWCLAHDGIVEDAAYTKICRLVMAHIGEDRIIHRWFRWFEDVHMWSDEEYWWSEDDGYSCYLLVPLLLRGFIDLVFLNIRRVLYISDDEIVHLFEICKALPETPDINALMSRLVECFSSRLVSELFTSEYHNLALEDFCCLLGRCHSSDDLFCLISATVEVDALEFLEYTLPYVRMADTHMLGKLQEMVRDDVENPSDTFWRLRHEVGLAMLDNKNNTLPSYISMLLSVLTEMIKPVDVALEIFFYCYMPVIVDPCDFRKIVYDIAIPI